MSEGAEMAAIAEETAALRAYSGTECFEHLCALLAALESAYKRALVHVPQQDLLLMQGATRQVIAMREALTSQIEGTTPRIL
jgi:hypothetical protein